MPRPSSDSATSQGCCGRAAWRPISVSGGARNADELTDHSMVITRNSTGDSAGFTLRNDGGLGMSGGSDRCADEIADCTSRALR